MPNNLYGNFLILYGKKKNFHHHSTHGEILHRLGYSHPEGREPEEKNPKKKKREGVIGGVNSAGNSTNSNHHDNHRNRIDIDPLWAMFSLLGLAAIGDFI